MNHSIRAALLSLPLLVLASLASAANLVVDPDGFANTSSCTAATVTPYKTIKSALAAAASNDRIIVCPAVYNEQLTISKKVTLQGLPGATLRPNPMVVNAADLGSAFPEAAVILVNAAGSGTVIDQLVVDAGMYGLESLGCAVALEGIYFQNAAGTIRNSVIKNVKLGAGPGLNLEGCQYLDGIFTESSSPQTVLINGNSIHDFQKNGITAYSGTTATITNNAVTGWGATPFIGQNGIQLGPNAGGTVSNNRVFGFDYSQCAVITDMACDSGGNAASGIIAVGVPNGTVVSGNTVGMAQVGIGFEGDNGSVTGNKVQDSLVYDGIEIYGNSNQVTGNTIFDSDESGIYIAGNSNSVAGNLINESRVGVLIGSGTGNTVASSNTFQNIGAQPYAVLAPVFASFSKQAATASQRKPPAPVVRS